MTRRKSTPLEAALVAIDVAKHRNEVLIEAVRGGRRRRMTILNTRADHDKLVSTLQAMQMPVIVGLEPTGNYHRVLAHRLIDAGFMVGMEACPGSTAADWPAISSATSEPSLPLFIWR
jgi:hypothetical protein